ncbi:integrase/recombinase XerC [Eubacterium ruminantium]|nr:integrase/recombinase XerC [Eubacterium ruminantium]
MSSKANSSTDTISSNKLTSNKISSDTISSNKVSSDKMSVNKQVKVSYAKELSKKQIIRLREITAELPPYVNLFLRSIEETTQPRTRIAYAYDIKYFFEYLHEENPYLKGKSIREISFDDLNKLTALDFEEYMSFITLYVRDGREYTNDARSKKRKLCALRVFFAYLYKHDMIKENVTVKVNMPKIRDKAIIRMDANETADFLDHVEYGIGLTKNQQRFHEKLKGRDLAVLTLMLSTGIRVSELVGLNLNDIDFNNMRIKVTRKGGNEAFVFFSDEAGEAVQEYLEERKKINPVDGHEDALFLSSQRKRLGVRSVELLVKKYALTATPQKHITPHKLRSTYGTALYQETGDIYLVADVLGHKDVNTTRKHYADMDENKKRANRNAVKLRED